MLANKEEEDRRAATLPSPIRKEVVRRLSRTIEASVWNDLSDAPGKQIFSLVMGNVHIFAWISRAQFSRSSSDNLKFWNFPLHTYGENF